MGRAVNWGRVGPGKIEVDFLITGDKDLLSIPRDILRKEGIQTRIVNPHEFLEEEE